MASKLPSTPALRLLRQAKADFTAHSYRYVHKGGTAASAAALNVDEHHVIKTLIFETHDLTPFAVLMHGDREVSAKALARELGVKSTRPCAPDVAERHSGYRLGGCSPFGLRKEMPILAEGGIFALDLLFINGGARGLLVSMRPAELERVLKPRHVSVANR